MSRRLGIRLFVSLWIVGVLCAVGCQRGTERDADLLHSSGEASFWARGFGGIAVTEEANATQAAIDVLRAGGNAVDAAVTASFVLAVTYPEAGNIGGGGFLVAYDPAERAFWALDFRETAPAAAHRDMYVELESRKPDASTFGPLACGIPGTPAGLHAAWERGGSMAWAELVAPAIELAMGGFPVGRRLSESLDANKRALRRFYATRKIFFRRGRPPRAGERLVQKDLAASLSEIASAGALGFYDGGVAQRLVEGVSDAGGLWTAEDLRGYRPIFREPHRVKVSEGTSGGAPGSIELITMPPPSSGAVVFGQTLAYLKSQRAFNLAPDDPLRAAALVEALRLAFADRNTQLADPARMSVTIDELLSEEYLADRARLLPTAPPGASDAISGGYPTDESVNTTNVVVMDDRGGVVALTTTVNALFGSKFVAPGTGILLNNEMDDFDTLPGKPNLYGLVGTGVNAVAPGARMLSSMSPTIVLRNGEPWLALGSRGGPRILSSLLQVVLRRCIDSMTLIDAVSAPRIHHQWWPDAVFFEETAALSRLRGEMEAMGYATETRDAIGRVLAAEKMEDGSYLGVRDPRISGLAMPVYLTRGDSP